MAEKRNRGTGARRGKHARQPHWIYEVEKALGVNHSVIARLLTPEPLTVAAIRDICNSQPDTPALRGLQFPVPERTVSDIIAGESEVWSQQAETLLGQRLGVIVAVYHETGNTLWGFDETPFSRDTLRRYLAQAREMMKHPDWARFSYFAEAKAPAKTARRKPRYIEPEGKKRRR